jgi:hypothetical protein
MTDTRAQNGPAGLPGDSDERRYADYGDNDL